MYDMDLDNIEDVNLPQRSSTVGGEDEANELEPPCQTHTSEPLPTRSVDVHLSGNPQSQQSHYQKLNIKTKNPPAVYQDIDSVRLQREMAISSAVRERQDSTKPGSQYESLQLKSVEKPSEYQQLFTTETKP